MKAWLQCFFGIPAALAAIVGIFWALCAGFDWLWDFNPWAAGVLAWALASAWIVFLTPRGDYSGDWSGPG